MRESTITRREFLQATGRGAIALGVLGAAGPFSPAARAAADPFSRLDATAQAALVRSGRATATELLEAAIARAEALNPELNAIVTPIYDLARKRAAGPLPEGPFTGVPTLLKDLVDYAGVRVTRGCRLLRDNVAATTHPVAQRIERSGMVVFGMTNTPEFGLLPTTESYLLGPARNPWNTAHSPGGSSGGAAVAVAAGIVPIAQGGDGGGSIRVPACNCGLFGMKCSRGREVIRPEERKRPGRLAVRGFVSRSVRDSVAALQAISLSPAEGCTLPPPVYPEDVELRPLRIAFTTGDLRGSPVHPDCVAAVKKTAELCQTLGHRVEEAAPPLDAQAFNDAFLTYWSSFGFAVIAAAEKEMGKLPPRQAFEPWTWGLHRFFSGLPGDAIPKADRHMRTVTGQMAAFHQRYDVWLTPVLGSPAVRTGELSQEQPYQELVEQMTGYVAFTPVANATGQPAMSVPLHWTEAGIPVGSHFVGRSGEEALLFALAQQLEAAEPWADRWPPVSAVGSATSAS
jgi:amidase